MSILREKNIYIAPVIFLGLWIYVVMAVSSFNFLSAFAFIVIVPVLLFSSSVALIVNKLNIRKKIENYIIFVASGLYSVAFYLLVNTLISETVVSKIINNTKDIVGDAENLSISNVSFNNNLSSGFMVFLMVLVFTKIAQFIFRRKLVK
ncbi:hypothetical protein [Enterococcus wangshanyuanii]|uniref:hypothetical protein n=1 Tax=Enterococcus wangshanyuanii TaxID=2005703 RepID=UPI000B4B6DFF|nr:hypothetical protein [Enterococcus wangshanyuanii]